MFLIIIDHNVVIIVITHLLTSVDRGEYDLVSNHNIVTIGTKLTQTKLVFIPMLLLSLVIVNMKSQEVQMVLKVVNGLKSVKLCI